MSEQFDAELRLLYEAAGAPVLASLVRRGRDRVPAVSLNDASLCDWLSGKSVPREPSTLRFLVGHLESLASARGTYTPRGVEWWLRLRLAAVKPRGGRPRGTAAPVSGLGRLIDELDESDALDLEVHAAITVDDGDELPVLPPYLPRAHDAQLRGVLATAGNGNSKSVMLVGGSSTGKTRACWEAMRSILPHWRVWQPLSPDRPHAVLEAVTNGRIEPHTVIWLNEAQLYLQPSGIGEQVASVLQQLLSDRDKQPVVVLGSLWPEYFEALTDPRSTDHGAARALLEGVDLAVPHFFDAAHLTQLAGRIDADPRLRVAAEHGGGRLTQQLAAGPELLRRYHRADEHAKAVLWAAADIHRLTGVYDVPREYLVRAAPGYLDAQALDIAPDDWFEHAIAYLSEPCRGAPGPLTVRKPTGRYRLADYLSEATRTERAGHYPPASCWTAAMQTCDDPDVLADLAMAAEERGRLRRAAKLRQVAADRGSARALRSLAEQRDGMAAERLWRQAAELGDIEALKHMARTQPVAEAERWWRAAADLGDVVAMGNLALWYESVGDQTAAERLARDVVRRGDNYHARAEELITLRRAAGDAGGAERFARQLADDGTPYWLVRLGHWLNESGDHAAAERLWLDAAALGDPTGLWELATQREDAEDRVAAAHIARQAAGYGDYTPLELVAERCWAKGDRASAEQLWREAATADNWHALCDLAKSWENAGELEQAEVVWREAFEHGEVEARHARTELERTIGVDSLEWTLVCNAAEHRGPAPWRATHELIERFGVETGMRWTNLWKRARFGSTTAILGLALCREQARDQTEADQLAQLAASRGDPNVCDWLIKIREQAGDQTGADRVARLAATCGQPAPLAGQADKRAQANDLATAERMARDAADQGNDDAMLLLAKLRAKAGNLAEVKTLATRISSRDLALRFAHLLDDIGDYTDAEQFALKHVDYYSLYQLATMAEHRAAKGRYADATRLLGEALNRGYSRALAVLAGLREQLGDQAGAARLREHGIDDREE